MAGFSVDVVLFEKLLNITTTIKKTNGPVEILPFYEQFYDQSLDETPQKQYG